ncbi:DHA2 family multidrug resistance protein-like MFS transporter [Paraburkholderia sp. BL6669N2]|uniref:MFS transporter n=1 Tax=Paraburkholderia sp. BL6669N2 TaxID=1938807 RepID=UPI000E240E58|nr:MFS transporter [Paraburkholderia sp. BL6669N2]REG50127.1 DHA2 family multidrug resistance protein-like MFS transporter [Paraburkholderia sp. BL6669N2]
MAISDKTVNPLQYEGNDRLTAGIVLAVVTFWLFAQTTLNVLPAMRTELRINDGISDIAVSITALFSGVFIVVAGGLADRFGRVMMTYVGLALSAIGSLLIATSPCGTVIFLMTGRIIQGVSAACIMPATLSLMKAYYDGAARQRALSFWSIGSWGGSGLCALLGGVVDATMGWRSIFWMSIAVAMASWRLIRGTPESRGDADAATQPFDWIGLAALLIAMVAFNVVVGQGSTLGWLNPIVLALMVVFAVALLVFIRTERRCSHPFVDFRLFENTAYLAATLSNFLLNGVAGALLIVLLLVQKAYGLSSLQSGLMTAGYLVAILMTIRVGEKLHQRWGGPRRPMLIGCAVTAGGIVLTTFTYVSATGYVIIAVIGFTLLGIGLGLYATPSTDAALSSVADARSGAASGIYKMASSLGTAFGIAISAAIFTALTATDGFSPMRSLPAIHPDRLRFAAAIALWFNVAMVLFAALAIRLGMPKQRSSSECGRKPEDTGRVELLTELPNEK